jgi:hypothetical protein
MDFRVDFPTLPPFVARLKGAQPILRDEITKSMHRLVIRGQNVSRELAPVDTGRLRNSIVSRVESAGGEVRGIWGTNVVYGPTMENGRRAGAPMPPKGALLGWMNRHGGGDEFALRLAISRKGIQGKFFMRKSLDRLMPLVSKELSAALARALERLAS